MTAIYGLVGDADAGMLASMRERLLHRGSQVCEWSPAPGVYFGQVYEANGLSSQQADLPITADISLYNREQVIDALVKHGQKSISQTIPGLILDAFHQFGADAFGLLNGDFAMALWDTEANRLILARDPLGARVVYYWSGPQYLAFAAEYKAFLALDDFHPEPDLAAIQYLQGAAYLPHGKTLLKNVRPVLSGHWNEFCNHAVSEHRYWDVQVTPKPIQEDTAEQQLRQLILQSVQRRIEGVDRLGIALSGGIDSSGVVAAVRHLQPDMPLQTFTAGSGPDDPEILTARITADKLKTDHHEVMLEPELLVDTMPKLVWHLEDPIGRTESGLFSQLLSGASGKIDVLLGGYASDGLYGGMPKHKIIRMMEMAPVGRTALEEFYHYTQLTAPPRSLIGKALTQVYFGRTELPMPTIVGAPELPPPTALPKAGSDLLNHILRGGVLSGVPAWMPRVEKTHAAYGIQFRSPFTDTDVVKFSFELPENLKMHGLQEKYILRRALTPLLPEEVVNKPKFPARMNYDLRLSQVLDAMAAKYLTTEAVRRHGLFNPEELRKLWQRSPKQAYTRNRVTRLWTAITTELWASIFLDNRGLLAGTSR
jgi:asparagine synthase (glutamine-hydrolysing)